MQRSCRIYGLIVVVVLGLFISRPAFAQTSWNGGNGDFGTSGNWSSGTPDGSTPALFQGVTGTVTVTSDQSAQSIYFGGGSAITLNVGSGNTLELTGPASASAMRVYQNSSLLLTGSGTLQVDQQSMVVGMTDGTTSTNGTLTINGGIQINFDHPGYTDLVVGHGEDVTGTSTGTIDQSGTSKITLGSNMIVGVSGGTGAYTLSGSAVLTTGSQQSFIYIGLNQTADNPTSNALTSGTLVLSGNSEFDLANGYLKLADNLDSGSSFTAGNGKIIQNGSSVVNVTSTLGGAFSIGNAQGGTGEYDLNGGTLYVNQGSTSQGFIIGGNTGANGLLLQTGGTLTAITGITVGLQGTGVYTMNGGFASLGGGVSIGSLGKVNLNSGIMQVGGANGISGSGSFVMGGGTLQVFGSDLTTSSTITLAGNTTSAINTNGFDATFNGIFNDGVNNSKLIKGGAGNLTLGGTSNAIVSFAVVGGSASQSTGTFSSYEVAIGTGAGGTGTYTMSGGSLVILPGTPPPIPGGQASSLRIGDFGGTGTFVQTGGYVEINGSLNIGNKGGHGTYVLSGGTLTLVQGISTLARDEGTSFSNASGELDISGTAQLNITGSASLIGSDWNTTGTPTGTGVINQTGGTVTVADTAAIFIVAGAAGVTGTYNLLGGTLSIGGTSSLIGTRAGYSGTYEFNFGNATLNVNGSNFGTSVNMNLVGGTTSVVNASGTLSATLTGTLSGGGALHKTGTGGLNLTQANSYSGGTDISTGTLVVSNTTGSATGSGTFSLGSVATLTGTGAIHSTTNLINGNVIVGPGGTATVGNLTLTSSGTTTFSNANLAFNVSALTAGQGNQLNVGSSAMLFGAGTTLTVNLVGSQTQDIVDGTEYVLFVGTDNGQYSDLTFDGDGHITNIALDLTGTSYTTLANAVYYEPSFLTVSNGQIKLTIEAVPEPGTWTLMLGGVAVLLGVQLIRRRPGNLNVQE